MLLSIITINLNNESGLKRTIESVINQSFKDFEYIIIDGGSKDGSVSVIQEYKDRINYWISEPDHGIYNAMNKGIQKANGDYLLFLNSGDYLFNDTILIGVFSLKYSQDLIYGNQYRIGSKKERLLKFPQILTFYDLFTGFIPHNSTFIRRTLFAQIGLYNEKFKIVSDYEFFIIAIAKYNCTYKYINKTISVMVDGGISNHPDSSVLLDYERNMVHLSNFPIFYVDYKELYNFKYNSYIKKIKRNLKRMINFIIRE